jgi:hypothetical protein
MIGFIDTFSYNLSYSQSIIALPLIYPLHRSLLHAIRFLATDFSQELSLQVTVKSSCHFLFNHLGTPTLQNSTNFSNANSLISSSYKRTLVIYPQHGPHGKHISRVRIRVHWPITQHWAWSGPHRKHLLLSECVFIDPLPSTGRGADHIEITSSNTFLLLRARISGVA